MAIISIQIPPCHTPENLGRDIAKKLESHKIANFQYFEVYFFANILKIIGKYDYKEKKLGHL